MTDIDPTRGYMIGNQIALKRNQDASEDRLLSMILSYKNLQDENSKVQAMVDVLQREALMLDQELVSTEAVILGLRGVIRELLTELRYSDPSNPLLRKDIRDKIFNGVFDGYKEAVKGEGYKVRDDKFIRRRDIVNGGKDGNNSGPDVNEITPNLMLRKQAGIDTKPNKVNPDIEKYEAIKRDQDKLLKLIAALASEVTNINPTSKVLEESSAKDTFETFVLAEMIKKDPSPI